ncbi:MAG: type II toxin-antitoxin system RelE/ParE family toxin [Elusimicrobia bacterium]|nr:type II toxin-antitoxin system RelE/ParE family toxin [Elusimicrobiota bacterium]
MRDRFRLEFYRTQAGREPALDYIRAQVKAHRAKIGRLLRYLEETGHQARRPYADHLGGGLYELRIPIESHQHRLLYFFHGREVIVVTSGLLKNEGRVPPAELERARRYRDDWLRRFGRTA